MSRQSENQQDSAKCATYLKGLADTVRLQIVRALQSGPLSVSDLAELLELDLANVSHHLRVLYHADIVTNQRDGKYIYYTLNIGFLRSHAASKSLDFGCCSIDLRG
ncbi:MAG: helix-turn-helix transcriptional regulator [Planctomycetales bacterium]|nr:helix-turn-helix transcriptional regulator [Planctomycetales bacterium]